MNNDGLYWIVIGILFIGFGVFGIVQWLRASHKRRRIAKTNNS